MYNGFIYLAHVLPWADMGVVIIIFTIIVKIVLYPLSIGAVKTQMEVKKIEPEINKIKEKYKDNKQQQALETMSLYKEHNIKPFSGFLLILIQLPIIFALYYVFLGGGFPNINTELLYSFVPHINGIRTTLLGLIDLADKSIVLSIIVGLTQFVQVNVSLPKIEKTKNKERSFKADFARSMGLQMRYVMPIIVAFVSYSISAAVSIYWITSNVFQILQEIFVKRKYYGKS
jgi:YidC/Oxa1 family membrane protein insertase